MSAAEKSQASDAVYGHRIPPPRPTWTGLLWLARRFGFAALLLIATLDITVWAIGHTLFDACVAVWCVL